jgi:hypothetical protein
MGLNLIKSRSTEILEEYLKTGDRDAYQRNLSQMAQSYVTTTCSISFPITPNRVPPRLKLESRRFNASAPIQY